MCDLHTPGSHQSSLNKRQSSDVMYSTQGRTKQGNDPTETPCIDGDGVDGDVDVVDMAWLAESGCTKVH